MSWRIEQQAYGIFKVSKGGEVHWACTAEDAVKLLVALEAAGR
jgi:hypothetical protein